MTTTTLPTVRATVRSEFGGDYVTVHTVKRTAGLRFSGPTVYVTTCGRYAHHTVTNDAVVTCPECAA